MNVVGKVISAAFAVTLCASQVSLGAAQKAPAPAGASAVPSILSFAKIAFIEAPDINAGDPAQRFPRGSRLVRISLNATGTAPTPLTAGFFAAADPEVSFDGRRILFTAQTGRNTTWQIWEIPAEGGTARQVTHCAADCVQSHYLPENRIAYTAVTAASAGTESEVQVSYGDGSDAHPITFGPGRFEVQAVLHSGRLLLSANSPLIAGRGSAAARNLYVVDPDGSGLMLLRQDDGPFGIRSSATEMADGSILFVRGNAARASAGQLEAIRLGALLAKPIATSQSRYAFIQELGQGTVLASRRRKGQQFDLYILTLHGPHREQLLYRGAHTSSIEAVLIAQRPMVDAYRSILHLDRASGRIVCLDAYASKDIATGRLLGRITRVRVVTRTQTGEKLLGEAPVELDGSFYATVPADLPIRLMLLGPRGEVVKQQRSWMWIRPGEDRGCSGCHESQALVPENRSPMTLQRLDTPTPLMGDGSATPNKAVRQ